MSDLQADENGVVADHNSEEYCESVAGIRRGLAEAHTGVGRSVDEVFDALERG
jgi:hypothetical protein